MKKGRQDRIAETLTVERFECLFDNVTNWLIYNILYAN